MHKGPSMFLFPISDDNEEGHRHHHEDFIHYGIILSCLLIYGLTYLMEIYRPGTYISFLHQWTFNPSEYLGADYPGLTLADKLPRVGSMLAHNGFHVAAQIIVSAFLHADIFHVASNMFLLWMLGDNVEYAMGHVRYLMFYLFAALFAIIPALLAITSANYMGSIGASGAVMAVAGAYMFYFPKARVNIFYFLPPYWIGVTSIPARVFIGFFALGEIVSAYRGWGTDYGHVGVLHHVMGFFCGLLLAWPLRQYGGELEQPRIIKPYRKTIRQAIHDQDYWGEGR